MLLTGSPDGATGALVDDVIDIEVVHRDGTTATQSARFNAVCAAPNEPTNVDLSALMKPGRNSVHLAF
jgi:hypothetical protein